MYYAAIAGACAQAQAGESFEEEYVTQMPGECPGDGAAHDAAADYDYIGVFRSRSVGTQSVPSPGIRFGGFSLLTNRRW